MHFDYVRPGTKDLKALSIKAFQQLWNLNNLKQRLAEDGIWGLLTYEALLRTPYSGFAVSTSKSIAGVELPPLASIKQLIPSLRRGDRNDSVRILQQALNRKGCSVKVDGIFGLSTQLAVQSFQQSYGLDIDGVVGIATKKALGLA